MKVIKLWLCLSTLSTNFKNILLKIPIEPPISHSSVFTWASAQMVEVSSIEVTFKINATISFNIQFYDWMKSAKQ